MVLGMNLGIPLKGSHQVMGGRSLIRLPIGPGKLGQSPVSPTKRERAAKKGSTDFLRCPSRDDWAITFSPGNLTERFPEELCSETRALLKTPCSKNCQSCGVAGWLLGFGFEIFVWGGLLIFAWPKWLILVPLLLVLGARSCRGDGEEKARDSLRAGKMFGEYCWGIGWKHAEI